MVCHFRGSSKADNRALKTRMKRSTSAPLKIQYLASSSSRVDSKVNYVPLADRASEVYRCSTHIHHLANCNRLRTEPAALGVSSWLTAKHVVRAFRRLFSVVVLTPSPVNNNDTLDNHHLCALLQALFVHFSFSPVLNINAMIFGMKWLLFSPSD